MLYVYSYDSVSGLLCNREQGSSMCTSLLRRQPLCSWCSRDQQYSAVQSQQTVYVTLQESKYYPPPCRSVLAFAVVNYLFMFLGLVLVFDICPRSARLCECRCHPYCSAALFCKAKRRYLLTCKVSRYRLLALHEVHILEWPTQKAIAKKIHLASGVVGLIAHLLRRIRLLFTLHGVVS